MYQTTIGLKKKMKSDKYTIYSISNAPYQEWQADLLDYSFKKVKQPGTLIRLCSEDSKYPKRKMHEHPN